MKQQFLDIKGLTELVSYLKDSIANKKVILPYASNTLFPSVGDINSVYIDTATNSIYRWDSTNKKYEMLAKAVKSVSISESTENGKITLTVDGVKTTVPIHGLKSAAYTESSAYATAAQGVKAESAVQSISLASGTNNGTVKLTVDGKATDNIAVKGLGSAAYTASSAYATAGHTHTKAQIGLGNVDNTADKDKSVKHATTADSATTATNATNATNVSGENATGDTARHVWFSRSDSETKRVYNDNFKYNPATNLLTTNITGSAASASNVPWTGVTGKPSTFTPSAHKHDDSTITSLNASKLFGTIDIARLPHGALERCVIVTDDDARFKLTTADVQLGDTVKVDKTKTMYFVINESKLNSEEGYTIYTAGTATAVPWSGVTGKPSTFTPSAHTHPYLSALSVSGKIITYTKGDGTTGTITTQDTWRGIQNNLTSDSTTDSLAAAQGKILKGLVDGKLSLSGGTLTGRLIIKGIAADQPLQVRGIVGSDGEGNVGGLHLQFGANNPIYLGNTAAYNISADGSLYSGTAAKANAVPWSGITGKPTTYPPSSHTHNYAGSSSSGGIAWNANALYVNPSTRQTSANYDLTSNTYAYRVTYSIASSSMTTGKPPSEAHILTFGWDTNAGWGAQLAIGDSKNNHLYLRGSASVTTNNKVSSSWEDWRTVLDSSNYNSYAPTKTGTGASGTWGISITGNAATATKLATARSINGTNFDGSGNITTATWGTARNITIGSTKKSVNGGADVSWSLSEIGAAASSHTHSYLPLAGGTMTGIIKRSGSGQWIKDRDNVAVLGTSTLKDAYNPVVGQLTPSGCWTIGNLASNEFLYFSYTTNANYNAGTNENIRVSLPNQSGTIITSATIANQSVANSVTSKYLYITADNEIRFVKPSWTKKQNLWFGWAWNDGSKSELISSYSFGNGNGSLTQVNASQFNGPLNGNASTATALTTSAGSATQPVYFASGKPVATTYTLGKSVPSNAEFTDAKVTQTAVTSSGYTNWRTIPWGVSNSGAEGFTPTSVTGSLFVNENLTYQPSSGTLRAKIFKGSLSGNASTASALATTATITCGDSNNTTGYRLLKTQTLAAWSNYRATFLVNSRHEGVGIVSIGFGCNNATVSQANAYGEIKYYGLNESGSVISTDSFQIYISADGKTAYLFEKYWDYSSLHITFLAGDFTVSNGTWVTSIDTATYGALKTQTKINEAAHSASAVKLDTTSAGNTTTPVYFSGGKPVALSYTLAKSVPADAKFTDTNTWRGVQNNLTSTATDQSLAAAQGKVLNEKKMGAVSANGYYGMAKPDGTTSDWIRTTSNGIIPYQSGNRGSGHCGLGTSSWYFSSSYVDNAYVNKTTVADKVRLEYDSTNTCLNFVFL